MKIRNFNVNEYVRVRLTDVGRRIYEKSWRDVGVEPLPLKTDDKGWTEFQMWEMCHYFGSHMNNGARVPFETTIQIKFPSSK